MFPYVVVDENIGGKTQKMTIFEKTILPQKKNSRSAPSCFLTSPQAASQLLKPSVSCFLQLP
jgi:hypothetical protein